jgi:hypothetical protein
VSIESALIKAAAKVAMHRPSATMATATERDGVVEIWEGDELRAVMHPADFRNLERITIGTAGEPIEQSGYHPNVVFVVEAFGALGIPPALLRADRPSGFT